MHLVEEKALLLEPTDDEAPIIHTSCSLFNTFEKQSKSSSPSSIGRAETAAPCIQEKQLLQQLSKQNLQTNPQLQQNFTEKSLQRQKQKPPQSSIQYPEIVEETEGEEEEDELHIDDDSEYNPSDGDVEYFNDRKTTNKAKNNNNSKSYKQKSDEIQKSFYVQSRTTTGPETNYQQQQRLSRYQHQLSLPISGNRQSISILGHPSNRRRRSSFIEVDFNYQQEQRFLVDNFIKEATKLSGATAVDHFNGNTDRKNKSFHDKYSGFAKSFNNDENQIIYCPTLDVSLRAQLSPRDIVLRRCQQTDPFDFSTLYSESSLRHCRKIGEGVYGEVFMNKNENGEVIVLKIIPIEGQIEINGEVQKNFEQILPEIIIAEELSRLRNDKLSMTSGFVEVKNVHCVQGCYPDHLIELWELYRDNHGTENDHPEVFPDDQLYIVLELANAGEDLEAFKFQNALQSYSAFLQVALSLAVAEEKFKFEHRDLHWGNILLQSTDQKEIHFKLDGKDYKIPTHGVKATIIDYTLSRMIFEGCCLYNDLTAGDLFSAHGDYQFEIYRLMQKRLDNQWENYEPYTNILWLHYTIDKMISGARYRYSKTKKHRSAIQTMMKLRDELLNYNSASDYVESFDD
ncbi:serine/threonine-protein kinase haspin homolog [Condylostylus longicornis]|uniref:serine/threonine-protein kinase haspin homolog n=1 Tax=Condylostylus longicornis TaxID=2530218 RepID=UPI00244DD40E|nr:serine/threonine-protein kinase haspin homolog [Condylostylus longicornis]